MKRFLIWILLSIVFFANGCNQSESPSGPAVSAVREKPEGVIVAVGDSLTEGLGVNLEAAYPALLAKKLQEDGYRFRVINAGISGETSSGTLARIDWILRLDPDIVILETGANDGLRGLNLQTMARNIDTMVSRLKSSGIVVVLAGMKMVRNLGEDYVEGFEKVYRKTADQHEILWVPFFLEGVAGVPSLNQPDGIHPTAEGYRVVVENLYPYVIRAIERSRGR